MLCVVLLLVPLFSTAWAASLSETKSDLAAARSQLAELQSSLDALAEKHANAEARYWELDRRIKSAEKDIARTETDLGTATARLEDRLVGLYKQSHGSLPAYLEILFEEKDFGAVIQRLSLLNKVADTDRELLTQVQTHLQKMESLKTELHTKKVDQGAELKELQASQAELESRLGAVSAEYKRLKQRVKVLEEAEARAKEAAKRAKQRGSSSGDRGRPEPGAFVFPVDGPHSFANTWGAPRSGGRTHKGTDIMASRGTPAVACVSGTISRASGYDTGLGGISIWLRGDNGTYYYYAHLDGLAGGIHSGASVAAGQTVGYVGDTGNAAGGACHLHFEIHPGGGAAINPYYTLRAAD